MYTLYVFLFAATSCYSDVDCGSHTGVCPHGGVFGCHRVEFVSGYCGCLYRETSARARSAQIPDENDVVEETVLSEVDNGIDEIIHTISETGMRWMSKQDGVQQDIIDTVSETGMRWVSKQDGVQQDIIDTVSETGMRWVSKQDGVQQDIIDTVSETGMRWMSKQDGVQLDIIDTVAENGVRWDSKSKEVK